MLILCCQYGCGPTTLHSLFFSPMDSDIQTLWANPALPSFPRQCCRSWRRAVTPEHWHGHSTRASPVPAASTSEDRNDHSGQTGASQQCSSWLFVCFNLPCLSVLVLYLKHLYCGFTSMLSQQIISKLVTLQLLCQFYYFHCRFFILGKNWCIKEENVSSNTHNAKFNTETFDYENTLMGNSQLRV